MPDLPLTILHVDMDAFYATVEQRDRPELRSRPVIVGGLGGRGVVSAASYEARRFGVHSALPMAMARRLCPQGVFLPVRMEHYAAIAAQLRDLFLAYTPLVEPLSLDEAFLDVRGCTGLFGPAPAIARQLKDRIQAETGLIASVGVAPNKFLAKLASDFGKPDGYIILPAADVTAFLAPLPVGRLWGVGPKAEERLHALGIRTVGALAARSERVLIDHFGSMGRDLWQLAHGQDDSPVVPDREAKSISTETTFPHDLEDRAILRAWLLDLVDELAGRLRQEGVRTRTIGLKVRTADFRTWTRAQALAEATDRTEAIRQAAQALFDRTLLHESFPVRLLGVGASKLTRATAVQGSLFDDGAAKRQAALDRALDTIRGQFGTGAIRRGSSLPEGRE